MNCPTCHSIMSNRDERHHVNPDSYRMNLHCFNFNYKTLEWNSVGCRHCHMGVIVPPPNSNQEWICDHYNFKLKYKSKWFVLRATPSTPKIIYRDNKWQLKYNPKHKFTELLEDFGNSPIIQVPFISISTNNDMHEHVMSIFNRFISLIVFS